METERPPLPPSLPSKSHSRDPKRVSLGYTLESQWRNRALSFAAAKRSQPF